MRTKVVGVTFVNEDGSSRVDIISRMNESDKIMLERDPFNQYDSNAVKVCVQQDGVWKQIGFIGKDIASSISPQMRKGINFPASIVSCGIYKQNAYCEIEIGDVQDDTESEY